MKSILSILRHHLSSEDMDWRVVAALLLGVTMCIFPVASNYITLSRAVGYEIQAFEPYIITMSTSYQYVAIFLGLFLLIAEAPFVNDRSTYEILRVGKRQWFTERIMYVNIMCSVYLLVMFVACVAIAAINGNAIWDNQWSSTMSLLAERQPQFAISEYRLFFPYPRLMTELTPYNAAIYSFFLTLLYGVVLAMVALFFNSIAKWRMGVIISLGVHIVGYVINANGPIYFPQQWSPLSCAMLAYYYDDLYNMDSLITLTIFIGAWLMMWHCIRRISCRFEPR